MHNACSIRMENPRVAKVAHPGMARVVNNFIEITTKIARPENNDIERKPMINRTETLSIDTVIALIPKIIRFVKLIFAQPANRFPLTVGTVVTGILDRVIAEAK